MSTATKTFRMRVTPEWLALLDALRRSQADLPTRTELVKRLVYAETVTLQAATGNMIDEALR